MILNCFKAVCFGEVLFDVLDGEKKLGGAPLNVALKLQTFGVSTSLITAVGDDKLGEEILTICKKKGLEIQNFQIQQNLPTGIVNVQINRKGDASYEISFPSAWDHIEITHDAIEKVKNSDVFIYGSLSSRNNKSRNTLFQLLKHSNYRVFDINLRYPHYSFDLIFDLMNISDIIKLNEDELIEVSTHIGIKSGTLHENIEKLSLYTKTESICITIGAQGAILFHKGKFYSHSGYRVQVNDTIGAGDSFLATLVYILISENKPAKALQSACAMGAMVAQTKGANPQISLEDLNQFILTKEE